VAAGFFGIALGLALWAGAHRRPRARRLFWTAVGLFGVAVGSATATVMVHTGEIGRYGVQEAYGTRVAVILLLGCALDAYLTRARRDGDAGVSSTAAASPRRAREVA
jgi:hypothetical protein